MCRVGWGEDPTASGRRFDCVWDETHLNLGRYSLESWESQFSHRATLTKM